MTSSLSKTEALVAFNLLPKVGPVRVKRLVEAFGSVESALQAKADAIAALPGFGREIANLIAHWEDRVDVTAELRRAEELNATIVTADSPAYPPLLREIYDPPLVLYVMGELRENDRHAIGVVGSRRATHYGTQTAKKLSFQLAHAGVTVVSGLARGIDTAAHEGAIAAKGRTIAVVGSGLGDLYPPENKPLAARIADGHGAVVSEFPIDQSPDKQTFPMRNRIISGWSEGTLVVEAPARSGALITVNQALEQGRSVYAVPGPIDRPTSAGANRLIQQGAKLVTDGGDILDEFESLFSFDNGLNAPAAPRESRPEPAPPAPPESPLNETEHSIYAAIEAEETQIDTIIQRSGLPPGTVSSTLLRMEMKRLVKQLPGNYFVKLV